MDSKTHSTQPTQAVSTAQPETGSSFKFSNFLNVHVIAEIVAFCAILGWFSMKNNALLKHIDELNERLKEQEAIIENHDVAIKKIMVLLTGKQPKNVTFTKPDVVVQQRQQPQVQQSCGIGGLDNIMSIMAAMGGMGGMGNQPQASSIEEIEEKPSSEELDKELVEEFNNLEQ